jgi:hypothetical protein
LAAGVGKIVSKLTGAASQPAAAPTGAYGVWPTDKDGKPLGYAKDATPNPAAPDAVDIYFGSLPGRIPPQDQNDLQASVSDVLTVVKKLYLPDNAKPLPPFRFFYTRLFLIAQLGLEGNAAPAIAKAGLDRLTQELIDAEGGRVKNQHLARLGVRAASLAALFTAVYLVLCLPGWKAMLAAIYVDAQVARSFMMLWVGCFAGVWVSYAIRTTTFTLRDLVITDADRLQPFVRLVFAGILTAALGLVLALDWGDLKLGRISLGGFVENPTEGLLFGLFCGVSELLLPNMVGQRATEVLSKLRSP